MSVVYSLTAINARLNGVVTTIDAGSSNGRMLVLANSVVVSTITLSKPSATVAGGVLTFSGSPSDLAAAGTGTVTEVQVTDSNSTLIISGLTAGIPGSGADVIISNGVNSTVISAGQVVQLLAGQITGS